MTKNQARPRCLWVRQTGFTLIELISVIVILGILGVVVGPKMLGSDAFAARGFRDSVEAALQYAQKSAVAQRRNVCVLFAPAPAYQFLTLQIANSNRADDPNPNANLDPNADDACNAATSAPLNLAGEANNILGAVNRRASAVSFTTTPAIATNSVRFLASGAAVLSASQITINIAGSTPITIEPSGYVY